MEFAGRSAWRKKTKYMYSPIKKKTILYTKCQAIAACDYFNYPLDDLRDAYNSEFLSQEVDAYVEDCKQLRGTFQDNLIVDCWVASEGPIPVAVAALIIFIIKVVAVTVAALVVLGAAASFVETIFPRAKFYAPDGTVFESLTEYLTYMQNVWNPAQAQPYTCMYCGQGFATAEERDAHQESCPWKDGPPVSPAPEWQRLLAIGVVAVSVIVIVPKVIDAFRGK